ncbi:hypothetical protein [Nonomuraea candida]|uniref:hypothetical protein n=1 Tax=Nonomuraea candida TaxID=359159 RepID=UPI0005BB2C38|nr:hypothetical protein [Nonomuraea candida]
MAQTSSKPPSSRPPVEPVDRPATSLFVNGHFPRRRALVVGLSALAGFLLTVVWSAEFVDQVIGHNVLNTLLGHDATESAIGGVAAGVAFALASGIAGTFTACNIAAFGALAPLLGTSSARDRAVRVLKPLGWLSVGLLTVSAAYGVLVALVGTSMPQFSTAPTVAGQLSARSVQTMIIYGVIGLVMIWIGLAAAGIVKDPLARISARHPNAPMVLMGVLIGALLIGRPFPLFRQMFRHAAESGNVLYGAAAFMLQSIGNIVLIAVLFLLVAVVWGARLQRWLLARPSRAAIVITAAFVAAGVFMILYWDVRVLARREIIPWYPLAPWA